MLNQTINNTAGIVVDYPTVSAVMQDPTMIVYLIILWFLPIFIYLLIGATVHGKSASGQATSKVMMAYPNYWYAILVWGLIQLGLFLLLVFPIWLKIIK